MRAVPGTSLYGTAFQTSCLEDSNTRPLGVPFRRRMPDANNVCMYFYALTSHIIPGYSFCFLFNGNDLKYPH
jgi:hypothetical protein